MTDFDHATMTTAALTKEMTEQMSRMREEMEALWADCQTLKGDGDDFDDNSNGQGRLVLLSEATKALLRTAWSSPLANSDAKSG